MGRREGLRKLLDQGLKLSFLALPDTDGEQRVLLDGTT